MAGEVMLALLSAQGGTIRKVQTLDLPEDDWAVIASLSLSTPRPAGSAVLYGGGGAGRVEAMLFASKDPDFKSLDDHVITFIFEKDAGGVWAVRERPEPRQASQASSSTASRSGCLVLVVAVATLSAAVAVAATVLFSGP